MCLTHPVPHRCRTSKTGHPSHIPCMYRIVQVQYKCSTFFGTSSVRCILRPYRHARYVCVQYSCLGYIPGRSTAGHCKCSTVLYMFKTSPVRHILRTYRHARYDCVQYSCPTRIPETSSERRPKDLFRFPFCRS